MQKNCKKFANYSVGLTAIFLRLCVGIVGSTRARLLSIAREADEPQIPNAFVSKLECKDLAGAIPLEDEHACDLADGAGEGVCVQRHQRRPLPPPMNDELIAFEGNPER